MAHPSPEGASSAAPELCMEDLLRLPTSDEGSQQAVWDLYQSGQLDQTRLGEFLQALGSLLAQKQAVVDAFVTKSVVALLRHERGLVLSLTLDGT